MRSLYNVSDYGREINTVNDEDYRTEWRRDYARLIHSSCFRRLQGKTQVFPGHEGDFFRNRLTHSLEVAQIAKSIAIKLNSTHDLFKEESQKISPDLVEFAGFAHDLGHPPFGHNGEAALDECMLDAGGFEGNAQTLRILSRLEKKISPQLFNNTSIPSTNWADQRVGLNLTYRTLASILKYDAVIPVLKADRQDEGVNKGYYHADSDLVRKIKKAVVGDDFSGKFKTIECSIMDTADDIAYSTYDLEDVFKSGFLKPLDLFALEPQIYDAVLATINKRLSKQYPESKIQIRLEDIHQILFDVFRDLFGIGADQLVLLKNRMITPEQKKMYFSIEAQQLSQYYAEDGYNRVGFTSNLVQAFLQGIEVVPNNDFPALHNVRVDVKTFVVVEVLKNITYEAVIRAPALQVVEFRGKDIVKKIFEAISEGDGDRLLPKDFRDVYRSGDTLHKKRTVCDFIAGMTDRYAIEFYSRLYGANGMTMHKPL